VPACNRFQHKYREIAQARKIDAALLPECTPEQNSGQTRQGEFGARSSRVASVRTVLHLGGAECQVRSPWDGMPARVHPVFVSAPSWVVLRSASARFRRELFGEAEANAPIRDYEDISCGKTHHPLHDETASDNHVGASGIETT
jgi:hypothetical protein